MMFHTAADAVLVGCVVALWQAELVGIVLRYKRQSVIVTAIVAVTAVFISPWLVSRIRGAHSLPMGMTVDALAAALLIACAVAEPQSTLSKLLSVRWLCHLGVISYSIYVWQQLFLGKSFVMERLGAPIALLLTLVCAEFSFRFIEDPVRKRGRRWPERRSPPIAPTGADPLAALR